MVFVVFRIILCNCGFFFFLEYKREKEKVVRDVFITEACESGGELVLWG